MFFVGMNLWIEFRSVHLQPGSKLSHILIVEGPVAEGESLGAVGIHFTAPGHQGVRLNSTPIVMMVWNYTCCES